MELINKISIDAPIEDVDKFISKHTSKADIQDLIAKKEA